MKKDYFIYINEKYLVYGDQKDFYNNYDYILSDYIVENIETILGKDLKEKITEYLCKNYLSDIHINISQDNFNFFPKILIEKYNGDIISTNDCITFEKVDKVLKYKCSVCKNKLATWCYNPMINNEDGKTITPKFSYFCDKHVSRTCSTNNYNITYFDNKENFRKCFVEEISSAKKIEKKKITLRLMNKYINNNEDLNKEIKGSDNILDFIDNNDDIILSKYEVVPYLPGVEYGFDKKGFIIYKDEDYTFNIEE